MRSRLETGSLATIAMPLMAETVLVTDRLTLRRFDDCDAAFVLEILNQPSFRRHIGDRGIRTLDDARRYIETVLQAAFATHGYGPCVVERSTDNEVVGMCGLFRREVLPGPDLGFALLEAFFGAGYATESAAGVLRYAKATLGLTSVAAIVGPANRRSISVLERLGFRSDGMVRLPGEATDLSHYVCDLAKPSA